MTSIAEMLVNKIESRGLDRSILRHDMYAAVNRYAITNDDREMTDLSRDQLIMYLIVIGAKRGDELWKQVELVLGETL